MNTKTLLLTLILGASWWRAAAQGTAFTYQGRLNDSSGPATGSYDLRFRLFQDPFGNNQAGSAVFTNALPVSNGLFMVTLDFGSGIFNGSNYWLQVGVKTNGAGTYTDLVPLQAVTAAPYALFALNAASAGLSGNYTNAVTLNNPANILTGSFAGNGAGISNVNAVALNGLTSAAFWQLGGNIVSPGQFLGSANNQPVEIWANGTRAFRVEPNPNGAPNVIGGAPINYVDPGIIGATIAGGGNVSGNFYLGGGSNHVAAIFGTIAGGRVNTVAADHAFIGGGISNTVQAAAYDSVIGGGVANVVGTNAAESVLAGGTFNSIQASSSYAVIGGGSGNSIQTNVSTSVIGGGYNNSIQPYASSSFLGGGYNNSIQTNDYYSFLGGGNANAIQPSAGYSVLVGGYNNAIRVGATASFLGGGYLNSIQANAYDSVLLGGFANSIQANAGYSFLGGGNGNAIQTNAGYSVLVGGNNNAIRTNAAYSFLGGGAANTIRSNATYAVLAGGQFNSIETNSSYATIGGGFNNFNSGQASVVAGGYYNFNAADLAVVSGGFLNRNAAQFGIVAGGSANTNNGYAGTIGGGQQNLNTGYAATIAGGQNNLATNQTATVAGGWANLSGGFVATVGGGYQNHALGDYSAISGGANNGTTGPDAFVGAGGANLAGGFASAVPGGYGNSAINAYVAVGGGYSNVASGFAATVAGGYQNIANGDYSFAAGKNAYVPSNRSFVWNGFANPNYAVASDEFLIFATNGFSIDYNNQQPFGGGDRWLYIGKGSAGFGVPATISTWTTAYLSDGGAWTSASDRAKKENFVPLDARAVLEKVVSLPIQTWNYTNETAAIRHLGPVSQDFHAAFGLNGQDDKHIADVDEAGVALAAIQGLNQKEEEDRVLLKARAAEIEELRTQNQALARRLANLEDLLSSLAHSAP